MAQSRTTWSISENMPVGRVKKLIETQRFSTTILTTIHMFNQISQMKCNPCGGSNAITGLAETYCVFNHSINLSLDLSCRFLMLFGTRKPEICTNTKIISRFTWVAECTAMMAPAWRPDPNQQSTQQQPSSSSTSTMNTLENGWYLDDGYWCVILLMMVIEYTCIIHNHQ